MRKPAEVDLRFGKTEKRIVIITEKWEVSPIVKNTAYFQLLTMFWEYANA